MNRSILVSSINQNPNSFQVKLPENITVQPNSEIGLVRGTVQQNYIHNFDSTNSRFSLLIGQYNMSNKATVGTSAVEFLPPQSMTLKPGSWNLKAVTGDTAGDSTRPGFGGRNILTNLVDTFNEQNRYYFWQFGGKWTSDSAIAIFPYICDHHPKGCTWSNAILDTEGAGLTITTTAPGAAKGFNTIQTNGAGGYLAVTDTTPLCYSYNALPAGVASKPQLWGEYTLPNTGGAVNPVKVFGGLIMTQQEDYKKNQPYLAEKDWLGIPIDNQGSPELLDSTKYVNKMIFSWELRAGGQIWFVRREINDEGEAGNIIDETNSAVTYVGTTQRLVDFLPQLRSNGAGNTVNELLGRVDGVTIVTYNLTATEHQYDWKHAICQDSDFDINFTGVDKSTYIFNKYTDTLGNMDKPLIFPAGIGNINCALSFEPMNREEIMVMGPDTTVNSEYQLFSQPNNAKILADNAINYYYINGNTSDFAAPTGLNLNTSGVDGASFHICIDNLPINNFNCNGVSGLVTQRIYSHYDDDNSIREVLEPDNIIYHKLHNKQPFMLDHLRIRVTDNDNRTFEALMNTTLLNLHIRENPHRVYQDIDKMVRSLAQVMENKDTTEQNFILANNVF